MVRTQTVYRAVALVVLGRLAVAELQCDVCSTNSVVFPVCAQTEAPSSTTTQTQPQLIVTVSRQKPRPTSALEILEEALEKQGLLVHKKDAFMSLGPQQKDNNVIPTAPFDADMKVADRDMYAPLLAHYPTRGFFLRLSKLLVGRIWMSRGCESRLWVVKGGEPTEVQRLFQYQIPDPETNEWKVVKSFHLIIQYRSQGECQYFPDRAERLGKHALKLFEFEYEDQEPDAVCVYVERHDNWFEQVVMGWDVELVKKLNCTAGE
ncbi:hypothetical protein CJU90_5336 [Yarrowia sp. C11]|nr:hypothetical protein CJU90_5336 [Yarrowia sp. C11]KAG5363938.1 hypothetical protein CKK34_2714 [Yarrowia sp. E02]